ncbi:universal stress protein [Amycolatopsis acidicola]|nr:universal stress protein [Amycolatopsis acidicola]
MLADFPGPVVAGVDGSPGALPAVLWAAREAARLRRELRIVHATEEILLEAPAAYRGVTDVREMLRMRGQRLLRVAKRAAEEAADVPVKPALRSSASDGSRHRAVLRTRPVWFFRAARSAGRRGHWRTRRTCRGCVSSCTCTGTGCSTAASTETG